MLQTFVRRELSFPVEVVSITFCKEIKESFSTGDNTPSMIDTNVTIFSWIETSSSSCYGH